MQSFRNCAKWLDEFKKTLRPGQKPQGVLVANKSDMKDYAEVCALLLLSFSHVFIQVTADEANEFAAENELFFFETAAVRFHSLSSCLLKASCSGLIGDGQGSGHAIQLLGGHFLEEV